MGRFICFELIDRKVWCSLIASHWPL